MKFMVESISKCSGRLGALTGIERLPDVVLKTPVLLQTTRGGSFPYMSREVVELTSNLSETAISVNLTTTSQMLDSVKDSGKSISCFVALPECPTFLCLRDTSTESRSGHHEKAGVPLFTRYGKKVISPESFMDFVKTFRPDFCHLLGDGDTTVESSKKRGVHSVSRTIKFTEKCLEMRSKSENLRKIFTLAPIVGGFSRENRQKSIEFVKSVEIDGVFIDGLHGNGETALFVPEKETLEIVKLCNENLPQDKLRMVLGAFSPLLMLKMIQLGVDAFDNSLPFLYSLKKRALVFDFEPEDKKEGRKKLHIDLNSEEFREDFSPVLQGCNCLTCKDHTRAYLRHLIDCKELMGTILLNIHNFHHYRGFFHSIHHHIAKDTLQSLIALIEEQSLEENFTEIFPPSPTNGVGSSNTPSTVDSDAEEAKEDAK
ncbi:queuine tRNA-ribosyltransferase accessory subunit 2 [Phlebotomus argentipes]|uniref:queuine tRNA-ribosyltransferase accessory subunit 2 n=1 Tax=Phlebotomus argentipes TaxID=94469 RepID=UPI0028936A63|nr:queuine tRNA-ribosyltransferase accessory subunit 2 [Phlebotomus argentipes]